MTDVKPDVERQPEPPTVYKVAYELEGYPPPLSDDPDDVTDAAMAAAVRGSTADVIKRDGKIALPVRVEPIYPAEMRAHDHDEAE